MTQQLVTLDVREDLRQGREPFSRIMAAAARVKSGQELMIIAPFEPVPLFFALEKQGFSHQAKRTSGGDWEVIFSRERVESARRFEEPAGFEIRDTAGSETWATSTFELDARGLEPPQPMVRILETLTSLPEDGLLLARTDRRPMHLYAQLEARGFKGETEEHADGGFITKICKQ